MQSKWDEALQSMEPIEEVPVVPPHENIRRQVRPAATSKWDDALARVDSNDLLQQNTGLVGAMKNFFRFTGHGTMRGLAETAGFSVDTANTLARFIETYPEMAIPAATASVLPGMGAGPLMGAAKGALFPGSKDLPGGFHDLRMGLEKQGVPTTSSKEEGNTSTSAYLGDIMGEFGGANLPFVMGAPEKIALKGAQQGAARLGPNIERIFRSERPVTELLKDIGLGGIAPGTGAAVGAEIFGEDHEGTGKAVGAMAGNLRASLIEAGAKKAKTASAWLHDFMGYGTGAPARVGRDLAEAAEDLAGATKEMSKRLPLSKGAEVPADIRSGDEGLMALRRTVLARDAELAGDYRRMQRATEEALKADAQLNRKRARTKNGTPDDTRAYLDSRQTELETLTNTRLSQALDAAEQSTELAVRGTEKELLDSNLIKNRLSTYTRQEMLNARDDLDAVTQSLWKGVNKEIPIETGSVYSRLRELRAEHSSRPGQDSESFPNSTFKRFFNADGAEKFGPTTRLQEVIDLDSSIQHELRLELSKDAPNRVYNAYLQRMSGALNEAKYGAERTALSFWDGNFRDMTALKQANQATKYFHDTFSRGPVAAVLGLEAEGGFTYAPGETLKRFLGQGPGGIDAFRALMEAMKNRTGQVSQIHPDVAFGSMAERYIRQDFRDAALGLNGEFNASAAKKWLGNNAGPMQSFPKLHQEFSSAINNQQLAGDTQEFVKHTLDDLRKNRAALFLEGQPGKLFNGALKGPDQAAATRDLIALTRGDTSGRATEGLAQMALDNALARSVVPDRTSAALDRIDGIRFNTWVDDNQGMIKALDEVLPGLRKRFERMANTARMLERWKVNPERPVPEAAATGPWIRDVMARVLGADIGRHLGEGSARIQTAAIGSQAVKKLVAALTPDQAQKLMRSALVDPKLFELLTSRYVPTPQEIARLNSYFYSIGIPLMQPILNPDTPNPRRDPRLQQRPQERTPDPTNSIEQQ